MLNPNSRSLYTSALTPPPGMIFDEAVATTFSMDPALLLEAPVYLALMAADGQTDPDPLAVLEAIRRYSKRITVYVQRGRIQIPQIAKPNPLFGFLENMVVEVSASGGGVFHPKVWAIRFVSADQSRAMYRLVVLSRNMTADQSWDLSLQLEGSVVGRKSKLNKPLAHFFDMLPGLANVAVAAEREAQTYRFAEALHRVEWELPEGFDELAFYLPGIKGFDWQPPEANRMAVISPFCSDYALQNLASKSIAADALISRPESLSALKPETLSLFTQCLQLDDAAETEDGEEDTASEHPFATGLHAKVYLFETRYYSDYTHVIMGSANATNAALNAAKNIEILVGLVGRKSKVGGIDELLGADGLGEYLVDFDVSKESIVDVERQAAEACVEDARYRLADAALSLECSPATKESLWSLSLIGEVPPLEGIVSAEVWPITLQSDSRATSLLSSEPVVWECDAAYVTGLIAFDLKTNHPDVSARFVLNLPITGIPEERDSAILQTVISNQDGFIRYLLLLLGDDTAQGLEGGNAAGWAKWLARLAAGEDIPLLEELTRTFSRHPERLSEVSRLVRDLSKGAENAVIPDEFLGMWSVFESAIGGAMPSNRFLAAPALAGLKDFQRTTVEYVFQRLYGSDSTSRFLVADEVGLGKTLVARGIIAKTLEHLQDKVDRVDVIYICSNAAIATQNVNRLNVSDTEGFTIATRLTYLPRQVRSLRNNKVNFISLTPGTAFDHARSRGGHADERAILYRMLYDLPLAQSERRKRLRVGLLNILQATAGKKNWRAKAKNLPASELDVDLSKAFRRSVLEDAELYADLKEGCDRFARYRESSRIPWEDSELRYNLIGRLRSKLASVCLSALEPDLVILDEFQRFKNLLDGDDEASMLATALFEHPEVRVLLLSATPYKMFTLDQETEEDDHYPDFIRTLNFLFNDPAKVDAVKTLLSAHRTTLHASANGTADLPQKKAELEQALLEVMCRTERVATTRDHNSMLREIERVAPLKPADLQHAATADAVAVCVKAGEPIEYWKSAPYLINFLKHYELRHKLDAQLSAPSDALRDALQSANGYLLCKDKFEGYESIDPANPRMRLLFEDTIEKGMWQLLWMPPSMPYVEPGGAYRDKDNLTKALVFSSWSAVPDAVASICSYEAERLMLGGNTVSHSELYDKIKPLLRFAVASSDNRLTGMPVVAWLLPSPTLATQIDPLEIALRHGPLSAQDLKNEVKALCRELINSLPEGKKGSRADERWYWAAPILIDGHNGLLDWCKSELGWRSATPDHESGTRFRDHLDLLVNVAEGNLTLGPMPDDLADVLCDLALAGPGVCALRALRRIAGGLDIDNPTLLSAAARVASGFRSLFNMPETIAMLRGAGEETYWRLTLQYGIDGNLQAVLDEYVHVLCESLGLQEHSQQEQVAAIAECIQSVLSLRTAQIRIDEIKNGGEGFIVDDFNTRCRFALRFGDIRDDNNQALVRADSVRDAFNSPFRPFVLASTSIGQEGLDFHTWCHAVVHWNLPSNPVDLEQREGRVHRYKGHAVRKNVAERYGLSALSEFHDGGDPWQTLFRMASEGKASGLSDLVPYWVFEEGSARVERRIPVLPYSKEVGKLKRLKQGLALYRMVFGQPRQEDLLFSLSQNGHHEVADFANWLISLQPPLADKNLPEPAGSPIREE